MAGFSLLQSIRRAIAWGVDFIQIREKDLSDRALFELTCNVVLLTRKSGCKILVNGRGDIALAAGAHGVHLPSSSLEATDIRSWFPRPFLIGASTHCVLEAHRAAAAGADYVLLGPVFHTESKAKFGPPLGLDCLKQVCASAPVPVIGLGGICAEFVGSIIGTGAAGVAGISLFQNSAKFRNLCKKYLDHQHLYCDIVR